MTPRERIQRFREELEQRRLAERQRRKREWFEEYNRKKRLSTMLRRMYDGKETPFTHERFPPEEKKDERTLWQMKDSAPRRHIRYESDERWERTCGTLGQIVSMMQNPNETGRINVEALIGLINKVRKINGINEEFKP